MLLVLLVVADVVDEIHSRGHQAETHKGKQDCDNVNLMQGYGRQRNKGVL